MGDTVRSFNNLPRPKTTPTGLRNHWVFGVRHVPLNPPGDIVVVVHPRSGFLLQSDQGQILTVSSASEKAKVLVPLLLNAFINGDPDAPSFAPWTWATDDSQLAKAIENQLKELGVTQGLCSVAVCSAQERGVLEEKWSELERMVMTITGQLPVTTGTHQTSLADTTPVPAEEPVKGSCSKCKKDNMEVSPCESCDTLYCSRSCLIRDWKVHKKKCARNRVNPPLASDMAPVSSPSPARGQPSMAPRASARTSSSSTVDAHTYYNTTARVAPDAQALMRSLQLNVAAPGSRDEGYYQPLMALVYTGQDTPENMQLLFGPNWRASIGEDQEKTRLQILLDPPRGSPVWAMNKALFSSSLVRSPRPATGAEQQEISRARDIQAAVRRRIGVGRSPTSTDMQAILSGADVGPNWPSYLQTYTLAINTMDQGVQV